MKSLLLAPLLLCSTLAHAAPTDWNTAARQDMQFVIDTVGASHAGAVSGQSDVRAALETGGRTGMAEAGSVKTEQDYKRTLIRFIDGFGDPHTGIDLHLKETAWTGIVIDRVDGIFRVVWTEPDWPQPLPPRSAIVQACDGVWIGTYLQTRVAPFINHSAEYPTSASEAARRSMFDTGLGWTPAACDFQLADGSRRHIDLPLRPAGPAVAQVHQRFDAAARPAGLYPLAGHMHWIAMPDFNGRTSGAGYEKLYGQLAALKDASWVVFDLRGNGGGDSSWGNRALQALYGKDYGTRLDSVPTWAERQVAAQATIDVFRRYIALPQFAASKDAMQDAIDKMEGAMRDGEKMAAIETGTMEQAMTLAAQLRKRPGGPRIAAVIDRGCFSSCMNFIQQITAMDDTVLLGEPTLGYSPYGELAYFKLPSGHGAIQLPSAIFAAFHAPREPFVPDLPYPGNMADEPALMQWVAATLATVKPGALR